MHEVSLKSVKELESTKCHISSLSRQWTT